MSVLHPTPPDRLCDAQGRPYFLWDTDLHIDRLRELVRSTQADVRAHYIAKIMRQAKPDDVFEFVSLTDVVRDWERIEPQLGKRREFWTWLLKCWRPTSDDA